MADVAALDKHPCAACGAQAQWNPSKQALVCGFCGTSAPFWRGCQPGAILELDLWVKALRKLPDEGARLARGAAVRPVPELQGRLGVRARSRRAELRLLRIPQAGVQDDKIKAPIRPQSLLPFKASEGDVREQMRRWYASPKWLAPNSLRKRALVDRVRGVYIPYWTFDAHVICPWDAEARPLLLHDRIVPGQQGPPADAPGQCTRALGTSVRRSASFL